jgi:hypothetical protein
LSIRSAFVLTVVGLGLACAGEPDATSPTLPGEDPPEGEAGEPQALLAQREAPCGYTHRRADGQIWLTQESDHATLRVGGKDRKLRRVSDSSLFRDERATVTMLDWDSQGGTAVVQVVTDGRTDTFTTPMKLNVCE